MTWRADDDDDDDDDDDSVLRTVCRPASKVTTRRTQGSQHKLLNQSDGQTEDGHAMMEFNTFQSFQNLSHAVRGCSQQLSTSAH